MNDVIDPLLTPLNPAQRAAVAAPLAPALVLAGAGSGKTRVLVHRIAYLVRHYRISPYGLVAVTFTNKAATEMRQRAQELLQMRGDGLWLGTFHGLAHRMLRAHHRSADLPAGFQILDADDQQRLVRRVIRDQGLDEDTTKPRQVQSFINGCKDEGLRPDDLDPPRGERERLLHGLYRGYEERIRQAGVVDFAELLLRTLEMLKGEPKLLGHYRDRFGQLLVDEFQDTNTIQYQWLTLLAQGSGCIFAVGDDDQSIYGWRGARVANMQRLREDFQGVQLFRLEQNYRSTAAILAAANHLISHNQERLGKDLWTSSGAGEPVRVYRAYSEHDEAAFVVDQVAAWIDAGGRPSDSAVLYRSNAQSRVLEERLIARGLPYRVYGGLRFFERAEVKDALAYLRLVDNPADDAAFERVVNQPPRKIGEKTLDGLRRIARDGRIPLAEAAALGQAGRPARAVAEFLVLLESLRATCASRDLPEQVSCILDATGLLEHFKTAKLEKDRARVENLDELVNAADSFVAERRAETGDDPAAQRVAFLAHTALEAGEGQAEPWDDCVQLMTLHSAKGLEFPLVFIVGVEEGLFPHARTVQDPGGLEEERRLCYVGITRARQRLVLSYSESRRLHGREQFCIPSRFLSELPQEAIEEIRPRLGVTQAAPRFSARSPEGTSEDRGRNGLRTGDRVRHPKFGTGRVRDFEGEGARSRVLVDFDGDAKWLVLAYARLERCD